MLLLAEQSEFASTAALFRPMAAMLEARFTRAADAAPSSSADPSPADTVAAPIPTGPAPLSIPPLAAPRDSTDWYPEKLLCKRFGVPMPHGGRRGPVDENDMNDPLGGSGVDRLLSDATMREIIEGAGGAGGHHFNPRPESTSGGTDGGESGQLLQLTFAIDRPPQEVFDRIFGDPVAALLLSTAPPALDGDEMDQLPAVDLTATDLTDLAADQVAAALAKHAAMDAWVDTTSTTTGRALPPLPPAQPAVTEYVHTDERDLATAAAGAAGGVVPPLVLFTRRKRTAADMVTTTESTAGSDDASTAAGDGRPMASDLSMTDQPTINKRAKKGAAAGATTKKKKGSTNTAMLSFDMDE
ncbi:hypothetical protein BC828DRAFT_148765 [Blastocladiella britannica]|nr:hypothetical protein BC828DRAFT_148765 [Blastocladiella britannica]